MSSFYLAASGPAPLYVQSGSSMYVCLHVPRAVIGAHANALICNKFYLIVVSTHKKTSARMNPV
jgi:hypothetical protein